MIWLISQCRCRTWKQITFCFEAASNNQVSGRITDVMPGHLYIYCMCEQLTVATEQSKQYLQVRWKAHRRRSRGTSMVFSPARLSDPECPSARGCLWYLYGIKLNVTKNQGLKVVWSQKPKWELIKFPCWMLLWDGVLAARATSKDRSIEFSPPVCFRSERTQRLKCVDRARARP